MTRVTVHKLDEQGRQVWEYSGTIMERGTDFLTLEARFDRKPMVLAGLKLERHSRFVETFYVNRWYNVFRVHSPGGNELRGWYCNLARPARLEATDIYQEDLALDLIVLPGRSYAILDRVEFEALDLPAYEREHVMQALANLVRRVNRGDHPFQSPGSPVSNSQKSCPSWSPPA
jgi:predicted RNA-binding protein associated with RNAse of E/G family